MFNFLISGGNSVILFLYINHQVNSLIFGEFANKLQLSLDKINNQISFLRVALGDFNAKSSRQHTKTPDSIN